jgi:hypothetical protein
MSIPQLAATAGYKSFMHEAYVTQQIQIGIDEFTNKQRFLAYLD